MVDAEKNLEERVARREHVVTDQGNGSSYCSNCLYNFGSDLQVKYEKCPKCEYTIVEGSIHIQQGGLDPEFYR